MSASNAIAELCRDAAQALQAQAEHRPHHRGKKLREELRQAQIHMSAAAAVLTIAGAAVPTRPSGGNG